MKPWAAAALALATLAAACTHVETVFVPSAPGHPGALSPRPVGTVEVVSGKYATDPPLFCSGGGCGHDRPRVVGAFKVENANGASDEQVLRKLESEAAAAGCEVLDVYPSGTVDRRGLLRGRPRGGTCLLVHKVSRFHDFVAMLPRCAAGRGAVSIAQLGGGDTRDREVSVRGVLGYQQAEPSCQVRHEDCGCCRECSLALVLADPSPAGAPPVMLMDGGDDATLSAIPGSDAHALGVWFGECERADAVRKGDRAEVIVMGVLRQLEQSNPDARWAIEAPSLCVVGSANGSEL